MIGNKVKKAKIVENRKTVATPLLDRSPEFAVL